MLHTNTVLLRLVMLAISCTLLFHPAGIVDAASQAEGDPPEAPWKGELDLAGALEKFLLATSQVKSAAEVLTFDRGEGTYENGKQVYVPNGIPDIAEVLLVQELVTNSGYQFTHGVISRGVREEYISQWKFILPYLKGQDERIVMTAAAYLTLGGIDRLFWLREALGFDVDYRNYGNLYGTDLAVEADADNDGFKNLEEWWWVVDKRKGQTMSMAAAQEYVKVVLDPKVPPKDWKPIAKEDETPQPVPNDDFIPGFTMTIAAGLPVEAGVGIPGTSQYDPIPQGEPVQVKAGRRVKVQVKGDPSHFSHWSAPGTLLDGSTKPVEEFVLVVDDLVVTAVKR